jgi:hypothetical protein
MRRLVAGLLCALLAAVVFATYAPALRFALMGDDYQWVQQAHRAQHRPVLLLGDLGSFYRPASTWTLVADRLLWGRFAGGYHVTNLVLHALAACALLLVALRLGLALPAAAIVALLWIVTPFTSEPAVSVAIRFENLLFLSWLGLALAWPRAGESWGAGRIVAAGLFACLLPMSKETWVVTPGLVWVLERYQHRVGSRRAGVAMLGAAALALAYVATYFLLLPGGKNYFEYSFRPLAKIPHELAAFLGFETLMPVAFPLSWKGLVALAVVAVAVVYVVRAAHAAGVFGAALLFFPTIPTLLVPYLPTRYTTIPYAGFLLLVAAALSVLARQLTRRARWFGTLALVVFGASVLVTGAFTLRQDLVDVAGVSTAHRQLVSEANAVARSLPLDRPVLVVRDEQENPLHEIAMSARGLPKLFYVRHEDPYGLVDSAALCEWALAREDIYFERFDDGEERFRGHKGALLFHRAGGFVWAADAVADIGGEAKRWRRAGYRVRMIAATSEPRRVP